jgi:hypothetical protein
MFVNDVSPHKFFRRAHFSSSFLKGGFFTAAGGANGNTSSPSHIGVPAKKASAIKIPKGFLLSNAPGFEQCVASLNFMTFSSLRRVVKDSNYFLQIELLRYFARYLRAQVNEWVLLLSKRWLEAVGSWRPPIFETNRQRSHSLWRLSNLE